MFQHGCWDNILGIAVEREKEGNKAKQHNPPYQEGFRFRHSDVGVLRIVP
jgi:hypothetical protein